MPAGYYILFSVGLWEYSTSICCLIAFIVQFTALLWHLNSNLHQQFYSVNSISSWRHLRFFGFVEKKYHIGSLYFLWSDSPSISKKIENERAPDYWCWQSSQMAKITWIWKWNQPRANSHAWSRYSWYLTSSSEAWTGWQMSRSSRKSSNPWNFYLVKYQVLRNDYYTNLKFTDFEMTFYLVIIIK